MVAGPGRGGKKGVSFGNILGVVVPNLLRDSTWAVREREKPKLTPRAVFAYDHIRFIASLLC